MAKKYREERHLQLGLTNLVELIFNSIGGDGWRASETLLGVNN